MTKKQLYTLYSELASAKKINIDGISYSSNKAALENAIECLKASDELLEEYLIIVKHKFNNIYKTITSNETNFKNHSHNRLYIFNTAKLILA